MIESDFGSKVTLKEIKQVWAPEPPEPPVEEETIHDVKEDDPIANTGPESPVEIAPPEIVLQRLLPDVPGFPSSGTVPTEALNKKAAAAVAAVKKQQIKAEEMKQMEEATLVLASLTFGNLT